MGDETQIFENYRVLGWEHVDVRAGRFKAIKNRIQKGMEQFVSSLDFNPWPDGYSSLECDHLSIRFNDLLDARAISTNSLLTQAEKENVQAISLSKIHGWNWQPFARPPLPG